MSSADRTIMIDGFTSVQAVRRSAPRRGKPRKDPVGAPAPAAKESASRSVKPEARVGRTTLPPRNSIHCYSCGYGFVQTGRMGDKVLCPKCREFLATSDCILDGVCSEPVQTIGTVTIAAGAVLEAQARIVARRLCVAGDTGKATFECQAIEIDAGGQADLDRVAFRDMRILENASCTFKRIIACRKLEVQGRLSASVRAEECVVVHAGGCLTGEIVTPHLIVEDGASLCASLRIGAEAP